MSGTRGSESFRQSDVSEEEAEALHLGPGNLDCTDIPGLTKIPDLKLAVGNNACMAAF